MKNILFEPMSKKNKCDYPMHVLWFRVSMSSSAVHECLTLT